GPEIEGLICDGIDSRSEIFSTGVVPTPALSYNVAKGPFDLGIMITASHNVWSDNGIKLFGPDGEKLPDEIQHRIEDAFYLNRDSDTSGGRNEINTFDGLENYIDFVTSAFSEIKPDVSGILLDCANGAVSGAAPAVYSKFGISHTFFNTTPDGKNINSGCGSMEPGFLRGHIVSGEGQLGVAFDGDGDRVLMIDSSGKDLDGDFILYIISKYLMESDPDYHPVIVGTIMSNLSLERSLEGSGIRFFRSDVGDRHVYEEMKKRSAVLGGEQSGHIIYKTMQKTGDGIITSLLFLKALEFLKLSVSEASELYNPFPQIIKSIRIREKRPLDSWEEL
ncbi:MAG: phosphoglucosamine mutase, partial [Candidatus Aminicenantes bacterium]|nr:phosphoglucosamine mutase [Candidatus Aminicenantes bacterium]